ncbi:hypothetical protein [Maricaulis maris]|uniref:hypothetical protein n=1 Tax=Maricaulis maris TaxID=74318 RepID=UPI003BAB9B06
MIRQVGAAVADAQTSMHRAFLELQENQSDEMRALGITPSWYELSQIDVELKLALHMETEARPGRTKGFRLLAASHNAQYQNAFSFKADGASTLKMRLSSAPPPANLQRDTQAMTIRELRRLRQMKIESDKVTAKIEADAAGDDD